jgi:hypothetical protein
MEEISFDDYIKSECNKWAKTQIGIKWHTEHPEIQKEREFYDFYNRLMQIDIELLEDYYLLFKSTRKDAEQIIQTLNKDGIKFIYQESGVDMIYVMFFDGVISKTDRIKILSLLSKRLKSYLEVLDESLMSPDFDRECTGDTYMSYIVSWTEFFYFKNYFNTSEYKEQDKYDLFTLPTNHLEIIQEDDFRNTYKINPTEKRIQVSVWN